MAKIGTLVSAVANTYAKASLINTNNADIKTSVNALYDDVGTLASLTTTAKTSTVLAINEVDADVATRVKKDGSTDFTAVQSYASTVSNNAITIGTQIPHLDKVNDLINTAILTVALKEYGLNLAHSGGNITVAAGRRFADDNETTLTYAGGTLTVGTLVSASPATRYYIFLGKDTNGDEAIEKSTSSTGVGLSTITGAKTIIGEIYAQVSSTSIDTTILVTYHADGTKSYAYQQASGNFPTSDATIKHNFNTTNIDVKSFAVDNSTGAKYPLFTSTGGNFLPPEVITDADTVTIDNIGIFMISASPGTSLNSSASYRLRVEIRTRL